MLSIAYLWIHHVRLEDQSTYLSAYADNWGWLATDVAAHEHVVNITVDIVRHFGMAIDWNKSWIWASNNEHLHFVKKAVEDKVGVGTVSKLSRGVDLGCQRTYTGPPRLGSLRQKFEKSSIHLQKLSSLPHNLCTKTHLVQVGIYPAVFIGCELVPIGEQHIDQLRSGVANALLGPSISRNSAVALQAVPSLRDPEEEILLRVLWAAKRFLCRTTDDLRWWFLDILTKHSGQYADCRGPIGTLKYHALRMGWSFNRDGFLLLDPFLSLSIMDFSKRILKSFINRAWNENLLLFYSQRKSWRGLPPIASRETRQVISKFPTEKQIPLIQEVGAAFQTAVQQAAWDTTVTEVCAFCSQVDTRHHRIFTCDAVQDLRQPFVETLEFFEERGSLVHELPVIHEDPSWAYHKVIHYNQPEVPLEPTLCARIHTLEQSGHRCTFFTDGSCMNPQSFATRFSAFAIVLDLTTSCHERHIAAQNFILHQVPPNCLSCIYQARTPGEQHIHRAELFAVLVLLETFTFIRVYTDSQLVLFVVNACRNASTAEQLCHLDDFDLVRRYWNALKRGDFEILKIKAHTTPQIDDLDNAFLILGNQKANDEAIWACQNLQKSFVDSLQNAHNELMDFQFHLHKLFEMILSIQKRKASLNSERTGSSNQVIGCRQSMHHVFSNWVVDNPVTLTAARMQLHSKVAWGPLIANALKQWMSEVSWPAQKAIPDDYGVTWVELSLSFAFYIGMPLPIKRADNNGVEHLIIMTTSAEVEAYNLRLSEHANAFSILWRQMCDLQDTGFGPPIDRGLVRALYVQGATFQSYGFLWRPKFPFQGRVAEVLKPYLQKMVGTSFTKFPEVEWAPSLDLPSLRRDYATTWVRKLATANAAAKEVRRFRKHPQAQLRF